MSYISDNLLPNEKVLFTAKVNPAMALPAILAIFLACILMILFGYQLTRLQPDPLTGSSFNSLFTLIYVIFAGMLLLPVLRIILQTTSILFTTEFAVTNRRVIAKTGFIRRHSLELFLEKIESVSVRQSALGRLFNFGVVTVTGTGGTKENFKGIVDPVNIRKKINQVVENYSQQQKAH